MWQMADQGLLSVDYLSSEILHPIISKYIGQSENCNFSEANERYYVDIETLNGKFPLEI